MHSKNYNNCIKPFLIGALLSCVVISLMRQIIYNPSISLTKGYYITYPILQPQINDVVLLCVEDTNHLFVMHQLGLPYTKNTCPQSTPYLLKKIVAKEGDEITINSFGVKVNNYLYPNSKLIQKAHQVNLLPLKYGSFRLLHNEYFVLGDTEHSYDSRYFGVIKSYQIYRGAKLLFPSNKILL